MKLTKGQSDALKDLEQAFREQVTGNNVYAIDGYSGSGKSTLIPYIVQLKHNKDVVHILAPTNKAVGVIREKLGDLLLDVHWSTLHSVLYGTPNDKGDWIPKEVKIYNALVIIDEVSMLTKELNEDLLKKYKDSFILYMGDSYQLEAIGNDAEILHVTKKSVLTEVCRHDNGILTCANNIRLYETNVLKVNPDVVVAEQAAAIKEMALKIHGGGDAILICATNKQRVYYNSLFRRLIGKTHMEDDTLIAVNNSAIYSNKETFNSRGLKYVKTKSVVMDDKTLEFDIYQTPDMRVLHCPELEQASLHTHQFKGLTIADKIDLLGSEYYDVATRLISRKVVICTWGYAISCHSGQGSQWENVFIHFDYCSKAWSAARWLYTAVTRASKRVVIIPSDNVKFL